MSEQTTFESLELEAHLLDRLDALNYEFATPVQAMAIPPAIEGKDVLATARTGTGKTAAFVLPILQTHRRVSLSVQLASLPFKLSMKLND